MANFNAPKPTEYYRKDLASFRVLYSETHNQICKDLAWKGDRFFLYGGELILSEDRIDKSVEKGVPKEVWEILISLYWETKVEYVSLEEATSEQERWFLEEYQFSEKGKMMLLDRGKIRAKVTKPNPLLSELSEGMITLRSSDYFGHKDHCRTLRKRRKVKVPRWVYDRLGIPYPGVPKPIKR